MTAERNHQVYRPDFSPRRREVASGRERGQRPARHSEPVPLEVVDTEKLGPRWDEVSLAVRHATAALMHAIPACEAVSFTALRGGQVATITCSDQRAAELDEAQVTLGDGPTLRTLRTGEISHLRSTTEATWGDFSRACSDRRLRSAMAAPLRTETACLGAWTLYSEDYRAFGADEIRSVRSITHTIGTLLDDVG